MRKRYNTSVDYLCARPSLRHHQIPSHPHSSQRICRRQHIGWDHSIDFVKFRMQRIRVPCSTYCQTVASRCAQVPPGLSPDTCFSHMSSWLSPGLPAPWPFHHPHYVRAVTNALVGCNHVLDAADDSRTERSPLMALAYELSGSHSCTPDP